MTRRPLPADPSSVYVIRLYEAAELPKLRHGWEGCFLAWADLEHDGYAPNGLETAFVLHATHSARDARWFNSSGEAIEYWRRVPERGPELREDGRPNRPLTGFTIEILSLKEALHR